MNTKPNKEYTIKKQNGSTRYCNDKHYLYTLHKTIPYLYKMDVTRQKEYTNYTIDNNEYIKVKDTKSFKFDKELLKSSYRNNEPFTVYYDKPIDLKIINEYNHVASNISIFDNIIDHMHMGLFDKDIFEIRDIQMEKLLYYNNKQYYYNDKDINHFNHIAKCGTACTTISASYMRDQFTTISKEVYFIPSKNRNFLSMFHYLCVEVGHNDANAVWSLLKDYSKKIHSIIPLDNMYYNNDKYLPIIYRVVFDYFDGESLEYSDLSTMSKRSRRFFKKNARRITVYIEYIDKTAIYEESFGCNDDNKPFTRPIMNIQLCRTGRHNDLLYKKLTLAEGIEFPKKEKKTLNEAVTSADDKIKTINPDSASVKVKCDLNSNKITCLIIDFPKPQRAFTDEEISNILNQWKKMCKCYGAEPTEYAYNQVTEVLLDISGRLAIHRHNMSYVTIVYKTSGCYKDCTLININTFDGVKMIPITMKYPYLMETEDD